MNAIYVARKFKFPKAIEQNMEHKFEATHSWIQNSLINDFNKAL